MTVRKTLILNADDVGMHPAVDSAVLRLAEAGVIRSASVMALGKPDPDAMRGLRNLGVELGLHLDVSSAMAAQRYGTSQRIGTIIAMAYSRRLDARQVRAIVDDQLQQFHDKTGGPPLFIDGHEHVHQLPVIREALIDAVRAHHPQQRPFIRSTLASRWRGTKAAIIGMLGARSLARQARKAGCLSNHDFCGVYDLRKPAALAPLWRGWLASMPPQGTLAMCHPAVAGGSVADSFRLREYQFLSSAAFADMLGQYNTSVVGWKAALCGELDAVRA